MKKDKAHCNTLQHTATHCNTLQHNKVCYTCGEHSEDRTRIGVLQRVAACCSMLQSIAASAHAIRTATMGEWRSSTLQHTANTLQYVVCSSVCCSNTQSVLDTLQHTGTHWNTLQHSIAQCNTLQHTTAHYSTLCCSVLCYTCGEDSFIE